MTIRFESIPPSPEAFSALYAITGWSTTERSVPFFSNALAGSWATCSAYAGKELVGFGRVISDGCLHAFITEMIVAPEYRGQHIGQTIIQKLVAHCLDKGLTDIQLFCAEGKEGFYIKNGFQARPVSRPGMQYVVDEA